MTSMYGSNEVGFKNCENEMQKILNAFIVSLFGKDVMKITGFAPTPFISYSWADNSVGK